MQKPPFIAALLAGMLALGPPAVAIEMPVQVAVYQGRCQEVDFGANLDTVRKVINEARKGNADFLLFPETFLSGYESPEAVGKGARPINDPALQKLIGETAEHEMVVMVGLARRDAEGLSNTMLVMQGGKLLGTYDKTMLTLGDRHELGFRAGREVPVFHAHGIRFAVIICHDTSFPHVAMAARLQGAELLFTPHNNEIVDFAADDHRRWVRNCHIGLACQLKMAVARSNIIKSDRPGRVGYGDSFILSPQGEPLAETKLHEPALITATITPAMFRSPSVWADLNEVPAWLRTRLAKLLTDFRRPATEDELRYWMENMIIHHRFTTAEVSAAIGMTPDEIDGHIRRLGLAGKQPPARAQAASLKVLPYPGGRHPRTGFLRAAIMPQRETKISVFTPWDPLSYVVVDVPEAIFSNLGLLYLAHIDVPTIWEEQGITLPRLEWTRNDDGSLEFERLLPNGIAFGTKVVPTAEAVRMECWLRNGTDQPLTGLRVQNCVMLSGAPEFCAQTNENKLFRAPYAACKSESGRRWVITVWDPLQGTWANPPVPCVHSDPRFPDCPPGETVRVRGWLSFFEGTDIEAEFDRIEQTGWRKTTGPSTP